ncbi:hypothetical protein L227DRAFT_142205 [Lentinus tigrinus ALCF2SS1-6]|uniref:Uncharacterized protein n=1 Tax=Lentinus tigrinus ALCF2SS1-6 TaxID=1328759 RepID=A0A5C2SSK3_9APHY|nr:hypothetical protein L227DRAFT_142205 [Lentinus tigrinus ALCF2SS1-6]
MTVTVVSTSSGSRTSSSTTTSTDVVFGMYVVEEEDMMLGVGEATRRVFDGCWTVTGDWTVWCCVCVTVLVSVANSIAVSVRTIAGGLRAYKENILVSELFTKNMEGGCRLIIGLHSNRRHAG